MQPPRLGDDRPECRLEGDQLFARGRRRFDEPVAGHEAVHRQGQRLVDGGDPFGRVGRAHRREDPVQVRLAHEQDALLRQQHVEVAAGMGPAQEQHLHLEPADVDHLTVAGHRLRRHDHRRPRGRRRLAGGDRLGGGLQVRAHGRGRVAFQLGPGGRVDDVGHVLGQHRVAGGVIAVIGADDVPLERLRREPGDVIEQRLRGLGTALSVGQEHAVGADHDQADGREPGLPDLLVAEDVLGQLDDPGEVGELEPALVRKRRPRLGGDRRYRQQRHQRAGSCCPHRHPSRPGAWRLAAEGMLSQATSGTRSPEPRAPVATVRPSDRPGRRGSSPPPTGDRSAAPPCRCDRPVG